MPSYSITHNVATGIFNLAYFPDEGGTGGGAPIISDDTLVPEGEWTTFASPFIVSGGGIGLIMRLEDDTLLEFLTHARPVSTDEEVEGVVVFPFPDRQVTMRVEHFEDGTIVYSHSLDLNHWTEVARFIPESPVVEVGIALRSDRDNLPANGQISQFRLLGGIWQHTQEEVWVEPSLPAQRAAREVTAEPTVASTAEPYVHAIVGAQFGDLEFDVGKSVRWISWFVDNLFVLDVNLGTPRYWIVNWTETFPDAEHTVTGINYFFLPTEFRKEQWKQYKLKFGEPYGDEWFIFIDAHEGWSVDNRTLPNDYDFAPFKSFLWREIQRAIDAGQPYAILPYYVFLRSSNITNVSYDQVVPPEEGVLPVLQALSVPYYQAYRGQKRLWQASELMKPTFDWSQIDTPVDWEVQAGTGVTPTKYANATVSPPRAVYTTDHASLTINADMVWVAKIRLGSMASATQRTIASQRPATSTNLAWQLFQTTNTLQFQVSTTGTTWTSAAAGKVIPGVTGDIVEVAVSLDINNGATGHTLTYWVKPAGGTWTNLGTVVTAGVIATVFDSTIPLVIGGLSNYSLNYDDRIYYVEQRTGLLPDAGTVVWRFEAQDQVTPAMSYADPRGRTWTLSVSDAIVHPAATPALPAAKAQIISYGYAHWNLQDIEPPATEVPPLDANNDDGYRMRNLLSQVRPIPGLPTGAWVSPASDPAGLPGPWAPADANNPDPIHPDTGVPIPQPVAADATLAGIVTPLYDTVFRINMRDGVWYESGLSGNIPLVWDSTAGKWTTNYDPELWADQGVESYDPTAVP